MDGKKAKEILKKQYDNQNKYNKENYDRIALIVPKGMKDKIKTAAGSSSVNAWITSLIVAELERVESGSDQNSLDGYELPFKWFLSPDFLSRGYFIIYIIIFMPLIKLLLLFQ